MQISSVITLNRKEISDYVIRSTSERGSNSLFQFVPLVWTAISGLPIFLIEFIPLSRVFSFLKEKKKLIGATSYLTNSNEVGILVHYIKYLLFWCDVPSLTLCDNNYL